MKVLVMDRDVRCRARVGGVLLQAALAYRVPLRLITPKYWHFPEEILTRHPDADYILAGGGAIFSVGKLDGGLSSRAVALIRTDGQKYMSNYGFLFCVDPDDPGEIARFATTIFGG